MKEFINNVKRNFIPTLIIGVFVMLGFGLIELIRIILWAFYAAGFVM